MAMHVISEKKLREFWAEHHDAESPLRAWLKVAEHASWTKFAEVRESLGSTDQVKQFTVFNIGGNKYRLIAAIHYNRGKVFVRHVMTHAEYDLGEWKND